MEFMAAREGASSARRRRDRQLRAWHRHVRTTVAMELATALHHSAQGPKKRVVEEPWEEELPVKHNATSGQNATPPWGVRPAHPLDVSVQPPLVAAACVAAGLPSLSSAALGGDGVLSRPFGGGSPGGAGQEKEERGGGEGEEGEGGVLAAVSGSAQGQG